MSVKIPSSFTFGIDVGLDLDGGLDITIPQNYAIDIPTDFSVAIREIAPIEIKPIDLSIRLKEIPAIRGHLPLNYKVGFNFLGREIACVHLCGQGQFITEPYVPYPCEPRAQSRPDPRPNDPDPVH
jgi:hypothetical protein